MTRKEVSAVGIDYRNANKKATERQKMIYLVDLFSV